MKSGVTVLLRRLWRPLLSVLCLSALVWMVWQADPARLWDTLWQMPLTLLACFALWGVAYLVNAHAFAQVLCGTAGSRRPGYWRTLQLTISGYALNYITPFGLLGGEPYRVVSLRPWMSTSEATSAVGLYSLAHIVSHVAFWFLALAWALCTMGGEGADGFMLAFSWAAVASLFDPRRLPSRIRWSALGLELLSRLVCVVEYWLVMQALGFSHFGYGDALLVVAFSSLFANVLFFSPLQMGTREGGIYLALAYMMPQMPQADVLAVAVAVSFATRVREFAWIAVGLVLLAFKRQNNKTT